MHSRTLSYAQVLAALLGLEDELLTIAAALRRAVLLLLICPQDSLLLSYGH